MMVPTNAGDEGLRALADAVPYLRATNGRLPQVDQSRVTFAVDPETRACAIVLLDDANEIAWSFDFPLIRELPPSRAFQGAMRCLYAPWN